MVTVSLATTSVATVVGAGISCRGSRGGSSSSICGGYLFISAPWHGVGESGSGSWSRGVGVGVRESGSQGVGVMESGSRGRGHGVGVGVMESGSGSWSQSRGHGVGVGVGVMESGSGSWSRGQFPSPLRSVGAPSGDVGYGARSGVRVVTRRAQGDGQGCGHTGTLTHIITMITATMMLRAIHEVW